MYAESRTWPKLREAGWEIAGGSIRDNRCVGSSFEKPPCDEIEGCGRGRGSR